MDISDKSSEILYKMRDIQSLLECLLNLAKYNIDADDKNVLYLLSLIEVIGDKLEDLITDYDKFDLLLYNFKTL